MRIVLEKKEAEEFFHNALCNGLYYFSQYGLELTYKEQEYKKARATLLKPAPTRVVCYEEVLVQILRDGGKLTVIDHELDGEYNSSITLKDVHSRVAKTPFRYLYEMIEGDDDADTADQILQTVFFKEVIFG